MLEAARRTAEHTLYSKFMCALNNNNQTEINAYFANAELENEFDLFYQDPNLKITALLVIVQKNNFANLVTFLRISQSRSASINNLIDFLNALDLNSQTALDILGNRALKKAKKNFRT